MVGNEVWKGEIGESGRDGVDTDPPPRRIGDIGPRMAPSAIGRSSFDILICCLTAVSLNCPRCIYPYEVSINNCV